MKRAWSLLGVGLALILPLTACSKDKAPEVTATPSPVVTAQPSPDTGSAARNAGDAAKDVTQGVGDAARDIVDGVGDAAKDIGNGVKQAVS